MVRSNKSKSAERIGKGKVTPVQLAYLVDRYLCDNRFLETRSLFRSEASSLISKSPVRLVPCSVIPLDNILNEYISLKEQKVIVDQEKARLDQEKARLDQEKARFDQEKIRVQNLLHSMQDVINVYNSTASAPPPAAIQVVTSTSQPNNFGVSPSGGTAHNTPNLMTASLPGNKRVGNFTASSSTQSITKKRKSPEVSVASSVSSTGMEKIPRAAKAISYLTFQSPPKTKSPVNNSVVNESSDLTSSVAKCLFDRSDMSQPSNLACLRTSQKQVSPQSDVSITPQQEVTPTNCTIVTKERITVSPRKQIASYTVERSHVVSSFSPVKSNLKLSNKRDHVKRRLNFDDTEATMNLDAPTCGELVSSSSSGPEAEADSFDTDFSNIDRLSENFPSSGVLVAFDIGCEGMPDPCLPQPPNCHIETASGLSHESMNGNLVPDQVVSEYSSTVTEMIQGKDMNTQGSDSMTTVNSITIPEKSKLTDSMIYTYLPR